MNEKEGNRLAEEHVDWFLEIIRPLLISWFEHGYKHGTEWVYEKSDKAS